MDDCQAQLAKLQKSGGSRQRVQDKAKQALDLEKTVKECQSVADGAIKLIEGSLGNRESNRRGARVRFCKNVEEGDSLRDADSEGPVANEERV